LLRIAYFSPLPSERSGISDYSAELLPYLAQVASLTLFADRPQKVSDLLREQYPILPTRDYPRLRWGYDMALYQMGSSRYHKSIYSMLLRYPGVTVLHDYGLHHLILERTFADGDLAGYAREMGYEYGVDGIDLAYRIRQGRSLPPAFETPLNARTLDHSLGLIVHSRFTASLVQARRPKLAVRVVPAPIQSRWDSLLSRRELGCPDEALIFASAGLVTPHKQIPLALEAFSNLAGDFPDALFVVIGEEPSSQKEFARWLSDYCLQDRVLCTGFVPDLKRFVSWIAAADVLINLRHPTLGETSATALRGMAAGRAVVVSRTGWYAELPDDVCVKVTPDDLEGLVAEMRRLAGDPATRRDLGARASTYVEAEHSPAVAAKRYAQFIEEIVSSQVRGMASVTGAESSTIQEIVTDLQAEIRRYQAAPQVESRGLYGDDSEPLALVRLYQHVNSHLPIGWPTMPPGLLPRLRVYAQKIARRLLRWYINPLVDQQNLFNSATADALTSLSLRMELLEQLLHELQREAEREGHSLSEVRRG
jgi:glycosyltransferase involved in cell wall biosynthesis